MGRKTVGWIRSRCLGTAEHFSSCDACVRCCPADALTFREEDDGTTLAASDACHGCGQCVVACPTEALVNREVEHLSSELERIAADASIESVQLACHRMAAGDETTLEMHCLHGLPADQLLAWQAQFPAVEFRLTWPVDCRQCPAWPATRDAPEIAGLETALGECGVVPRWSNRTTAAHWPFDPAAARRSRRRLFTALLRPDAATGVAADDAHPAPRRRQRLGAAAARLYGQEAAERLVPLPEVTLDTGRCEATGLCVRLCPSGALHEVEEESLHFKAGECLGCGICESHCPSRALRLGESPAQTGRRNVTRLRSGKRATCFQCAHSFVVAEATSDGLDPVCHACRKDSALMTGQFQPGVSA